MKNTIAAGLALCVMAMPLPALGRTPLKNYFDEAKAPFSKANVFEKSAGDTWERFNRPILNHLP